MTYLLPPLNALRAFEAAARHRGFTRAAQELHVSAGAVGQQVRALERLLGTRLFERRHNQLVLSEAGGTFAASLGDAFSRLAAASAALRPAHAALVRLGVRVGISLTGMRGLVAEIERFRAAMGAPPSVVVRLSQPAGLHELIEGKIDMAIARGPIRQPFYRCDALPETDWLAAGDCLIAPDGTADCPEIAAIRHWLLTAATRRVPPGLDRPRKSAAA